MLREVSAYIYILFLKFLLSFVVAFDLMVIVISASGH